MIEQTSGELCGELDGLILDNNSSYSHGVGAYPPRCPLRSIAINDLPGVVGQSLGGIG